MMTGRRRRWIPIAIGIAFLVVCFAIAMVVVSLALFRVEVTRSTEGEAVGARDEVLHRFADRPALLEIRGGRLRRVQASAPARASATPQSMNVLVWDPGNGELARTTLPFWFLRLKSGPVSLGTYVTGLDGNVEGSSLSVDDLEAHGPGLVLDHTSPRGHRVLIWLE